LSPYISKSGASGGQPLTDLEKRARRERRTLTAGFGGEGGGGNTSLSGNQSFFSPQLSTDFLELPQSLREKREIYRHFYNTDEIVAQAIDLHTELPMSKVRLAAPKPRTYPKRFKNPEDYGKYILTFFERMSKKIKLFQRLITMVHHYWLDGTVCLPPDEFVSVNGGIKLAEDVEIGDLVLTHKGRWSPVTAIKQLQTQELIHLDIARLPGELRVTPEHPIEVMLADGSDFIPAFRVKEGDHVRVTWPNETVDTHYVNTLSNAPENVCAEIMGGYSVKRTQTKLRTKNAVRARSFLLAWLAGLNAPVMRSRASIALEAGVSEMTLNNVILTLQEDIPCPFRVRIPTGKKDEAHTLWLPTAQASLTDDAYDITRKWVFHDAKVEFPVDEDFLYVLGYWLGDGSLGRDSSRSTSWGRGLWTICGADSSLVYMARVEACLHRILGSASISRTVEKCEDSTLHVLRLRGNPAFVEWWAENFGETAHGLNPKRVPLWVLALPEEKQLALLAGLIDSDGSVVNTHVGGVIISNTSLNIVSAARDIMLRLGVVPALNGKGELREPTYLRGHWVYSRHPMYSLSVCTENEARKIASRSCKVSRLDTAPRFFTSYNSYVRREEGLYFRVNGVRTLPGNIVYNFQVEGDATFRARFVSTHNCCFAEDSGVSVPDNVGFDRQVVKNSILTDSGEAKEQDEDTWVEKTNREEEELAYYQKHYKGWDRLIIFPIDQLQVTAFNYTDKVRLELIPSDRDRGLIERANQGDPIAEEMVQEIPQEVREYIAGNQMIPLGTDPDEGSFAYLLSGRKGAGDDLGQSILDRCLRTLYLRDKLRQAQTQIASRAMTPKRIVWAEDISEVDVENLREQVDISLVDPDYSIVTNYEVHWEEMGSKDRLLDLSSEYEQAERRLRTGLGVTEALLSGETLYSGDRLKLEVINQRYLFLREILQEYVEEYLFKPVARRKGFIEEDEWGDEVVLYPRLSFTRLPLRDSQDTYDALFNLYQKGSISIDIILEMFNIDPHDTKLKLERDLFTVNDATFNEVVRGIYSAVGNALAENTDVADKIRDYLGLKAKEAPAEEGRF
jgi:hypothetical protein